MAGNIKRIIVEISVDTSFFQKALSKVDPDTSSLSNNKYLNTRTNKLAYRIR